MEDKKIVRMDGVLWNAEGLSGRNFQALCPIHHLRMKPYPQGHSDYSTNLLECIECKEPYFLTRTVAEEKEYVRNKIDSKAFKQIKILNLDDEAVPIAESKISSCDGKFFVKSILTESKIGQRLVIYAGEKGKKEKTQIFVEPAIKRLAFDQKDLHPADVFLKVEATFEDGKTSSISKSETQKRNKK